jgi:hypothetical protein
MQDPLQELHSARSVMRPRVLRRIAWTAVSAAILIGVLPSSDSIAKGQSRVPFTISSFPGVQYPAMAVDGNGTGYFVWDLSNGTANNPLQYCRVPRGATKCDVTKTFNLKNFADGHPQVLLPAPGEVVLTTYRCCDGALYAITSEDGGKTFGSPRIIGSIEPYQTILGPGEGTISVIDGPAVTEGIHYQATSPTGLTDLAANVGDTSAGVMPYDPALGFTDINTPIVAFVNEHETAAYYRVWSGNGDVNDVSSWGGIRPLGALTDLQMASGVRGLVLMGKKELTNPSRDVYVARRWNPVTKAFGPTTNLSNPKIEPSVTNRNIAESANGDLVAVFEDGQAIKYRASIDGGDTWLPEQTWLTTDEDASNLTTAVGPDGGGWIAWQDEYGLRAAAIPAVSTLPGGTPSSSCPQTLKIGTAQMMAVAGCFLKGQGNKYSATGPVRVDGLDLYPDAAGKIIVDAVTGAISANGVEALAGNVVLDNGNFNWNLGTGGLAATFPDLGSFHDSIFGFGVTGDATLSFANGVATIPVHLELPGMFDGVTGDMTLTLKNPGGLELKQLHIHVGDAFLGLLEVKNLDVTYTGGEPPSLEGKASFFLPPTYSQPSVDVGFGFSGGEFSHAEGSFPLTVPLFPPFLYLQKIGLALSANPLTIKGGVELSGGPQILGGAAIQMDALPADDGGFTFQLSNPAVLRLSGKMSVVGIPFADGFVEYDTNGLLKFGGGLNYTLPLNVASVQAGVPENPPLGPGFVDLSTGRFNAPMQGQVCVPAGCNVIDIGAQGVISSSGLAACGQYILYQGPPGPTVGVSTGFGYHWGESPHISADLGGCDVSPYATSIQAVHRYDTSTHGVVQVAAGLPQENIVIQGASGAPQVAVKAPNGETVTSATGGLAKSMHMALFSDPSADRTYVLIGQPPAGQYTIDTITNSPAISSVRQAQGLPAPSVTGSVTGSGMSRTLTYTVKSIPGQTVVFAEKGVGVAAQLGAATGTEGTLKFTPTAGPKGIRQVIAEVEENGIPRANIVVSSYVAPASAGPPSPKFVRVQRKKSTLTVTWAKVNLAARYAVHVFLKDGRNQMLLLPAKQTMLRIANVSRSTHGYVTVAAMSVDGLRGEAKRVKV